MLRLPSKSGGFGIPRKVRAVAPGGLKGPGGDCDSAAAELAYGPAGQTLPGLVLGRQQGRDYRGCALLLRSTASTEKQAFGGASGSNGKTPLFIGISFGVGEYFDAAFI